MAWTHKYIPSYSLEKLRSSIYWEYNPSRSPGNLFAHFPPPPLRCFCQMYEHSNTFAQ